jgi:hypothetical protein
MPEIPPVFPLSISTGTVLPLDAAPYEERRVELRLVPTLSVLAAACLACSGASKASAVAALVAPIVLAVSIWPLSGGPAIILSQRRS